MGWGGSSRPGRPIEPFKPPGETRRFEALQVIEFNSQVGYSIKVARALATNHARISRDSHFCLPESQYVEIMVVWTDLDARGLGAPSSRPRSRINLIWIMADDLGYADLGCYGQKVIQTPELDQMAREGMGLPIFTPGATVCAPSRSV